MRRAAPKGQPEASRAYKLSFSFVLLSFIEYLQC
jgi:hypothetical protein